MNTKELYLKKCLNLTLPKGAREATAIQACDQCEEEKSMSGNFALDVYLEQLKQRKIIIKGVIDESMVEKVVIQLMRMNEEDDIREEVERGYDRMHSPISLYISSPGGYISEGLSVVSQIVQSQTPVLGYAIGDCSSMGAVILASCHARFASIYSTIMVHSLSSGYGGKLHDKIDDVEESKRLQKILDDIITSRTLITQKQLDVMHTKREDWYMSAAEALKLGVIDEVIPQGLKLTSPKKRKVAAKKA